MTNTKRLLPVIIFFGFILAACGSREVTPTAVPPTPTNPSAPPTHPPATPTAETKPATCTAGDPNQSPLYDHQVYVTTSPDGAQFDEPGALILEHASVPDGVIGPDGKLWVYFINGEPGQHGIFAARLSDAGAWEVVDCVKLDGRFEGNAVDPDITRLPDGRYRLVYFLGSFVGGPPLDPNQPHPIYSAISADGINFTIEQQLIAVEGVTDPSLVQLPDGRWLLAMTRSGETLLAASDDGANFELTGVTFNMPGIPELAVLPDGRVRLYLSQSLISADGGQTWTVEESSSVPGGGADPSLVALPDGGYAFFYKGFSDALENPAAGQPENPPRPATDTFGIFSFPAGNERAWQALSDLGVGWVRLQFRLGEEDPAAYTRVLSEGYGLWLTLYPRDATNVADPEKLARSERGGFPPVDDESYQALVEATLAPLVETLRAEGKNSGDWLVVQLGNESIPSDVLPDQPQRFWHGTADEYLHTLGVTYQAVKSVDPSIPVAMTSLSSEAMEAVLAYETGETQYQPIADWAARLLAEAQADWADIHLYHSVDTISDKVAWYRTRWDGRLAASEIGGPDSAVTSAVTEASHAADLDARLAAALEAGVTRLFWTTLIEQPAFGDRYNPMALITADGRSRQAFFTYQQRIQNAQTTPANQPSDSPQGQPDQPEPPITSTGDFIPCSGYGEPLDEDGSQIGPWASRLMIAFSDDGLTFTHTGQILADQADVPDVLVMPGGEIHVYFVTLCPEEVRNQIVVAVSLDGVNWTYRKTSITGMTDIQPIAVDPTVEFTPDGRIRLYFTSVAASPDALPQSYSAISDDGYAFEMETGARFGVDGSRVLDPTALRIGDTWHYFGGGQPGINYHAASPDGLTFTRQDDLKVNDFLFANGIAVEGGYRYYGFIQQPKSAVSAIYSVFTTDGQSWVLEDGVRLALDESSPLEKIGVKDPGVAQLPDGRYLMIYSTLIPEYPYDEP